MARFLDEHDGVEVELLLNERNVDLIDEGIDVALRIGPLADSTLSARLVGHVRRLWVASPAYLAANPGPKSIEDLLQHQFIHLEEPFRPRPRWHDWFQFFGVDFVDKGEGLRLNDYALVIQAAMAGEGIAMGWRNVTDSLIRKRLLVPVLPQSWKSGEEFHLIWSDRTELSESTQQVRD